VRTAIIQKEKEGIAVRTTTAEAFLERIQSTFDAVSCRTFEMFEANGRLASGQRTSYFIPFTSISTNRMNPFR
jgi:hypothetical protein